MRKITLFLAVIGMIMLSSCEGPQGVPGRDGVSVEAEVFEVTRTFSNQNNFSSLINLNPAILPADKILVYRLSGIDNGQDVWRLMPQYYFFQNGTLDFGYNFDFTRYNILLFMEGNDLGTLDSQWRINQVFRVVIIPGYSSNFKMMSFKDYHQTMEIFGLSETDVKPIESRK